MWCVLCDGSDWCSWSTEAVVLLQEDTDVRSDTLVGRTYQICNVSGRMASWIKFLMVLSRRGGYWFVVF